MGQLVLEPKPKTFRGWSQNQKNWCLELEPEIWVPAPQPWPGAAELGILPRAKAQITI